METLIVLGWYKASLTGLTFLVAIVGGYWGSQTYSEVGLAALYAFGAAVCLVVGMVPTRPKTMNSQTIRYVNRSMVAALTVLAGWHALQNELVEASWQAIVPPAILAVIMVMAVVGIWVGGLNLAMAKQTRRCDHRPHPPTGSSTGTGRAFASKQPSS